MGYVNSEEGMRFIVIRSVLNNGIWLKWLHHDADLMVQSTGDQGYIATWHFVGRDAYKYLEEKLGEIALVCEGYTVHNYLHNGSCLKYESTECCSILKPEIEETEDE